MSAFDIIKYLYREIIMILFLNALKKVKRFRIPNSYYLEK